MNWSALDFSIIGPALLAGLLVTSTHVPLGQRVLERGIIFLDLAVASANGRWQLLKSIAGKEFQEVTADVGLPP